MSDFSDTQCADDPTLPCLRGNWFLSDFSTPRQVQFSINDERTGPLPNRSPYRLINDLPGTTNSLECMTPRGTFTLIEDLSLFRRTMPEETGVLVGDFSDDGLVVGQSVGPGRDMPDEDVWVLDLSEFHTYLTLPNGVIDINTAADGVLVQLARAIVLGLGAIDGSFRADEWARETNGVFDFQFIGTNTTPLLLELGQMLSVKGYRQFLIDAFRSNMTIANVWTHRSGELMIAFRGSAGLRQYLDKSRYSIADPQVALIASAIKDRTSWAQVAKSSLKSVGGRIPIISYVIVGSIDVAEWISSSEGQREFSDLMAVLFVDIPKLAVSTVLATVVGILALGSASPVWMAVMAGIGAGVLVGIGLDWLDSKFNILPQVKRIFGEIGDSLNQFMEDLKKGLNNWAADRMTTDPMLVEMATGAPPNAVAQAMRLPGADYGIVYDNDVVNSVNDYLVRNGPAR